MKRLFLCLLLGCSSPEIIDNSNQQGNQTYPGGLFSGGGGRGSGPCSGRVQIVRVDVPDAEPFTVILPIPCNPNYIDKGDPPPYERKFYSVDPSPDERTSPQIRLEERQNLGR